MTLAKAKLASSITFIVLIVTYDGQNMFIIQATVELLLSKKYLIHTTSFFCF
jgi:hypothetical protein